MSELSNTKSISSIDSVYGYFSKPIATLHEFYLNKEILEPDVYTDWYDIIRNAREDDSVVIHINSCGGNIATALQMLRAMTECRAEITCSVEGDCMSAATMIFLQGDILEVSPHSVFMFHNYSGGIFGKGGEMYDTVIHERNWSISLLTSMYKHFLTSEEIAAILENKDIWMDSEEVVKRLTKRAELMAKEDAEQDNS